MFYLKIMAFPYELMLIYGNLFKIEKNTNIFYSDLKITNFSVQRLFLHNCSKCFNGGGANKCYIISILTMHYAFICASTIHDPYLFENVWFLNNFYSFQCVIFLVKLSYHSVVFLGNRIMSSLLKWLFFSNYLLLFLIFTCTFFPNWKNLFILLVWQPKF